MAKALIGARRSCIAPTCTRCSQGVPNSGEPGPAAGPAVPPGLHLLAGPFTVLLGATVQAAAITHAVVTTQPPAAATPTLPGRLKLQPNRIGGLLDISDTTFRWPGAFWPVDLGSTQSVITRIIVRVCAGGGTSLCLPGA